jgi:hypothetical protein
MASACSVDISGLPSSSTICVIRSIVACGSGLIVPSIPIDILEASPQTHLCFSISPRTHIGFSISRLFDFTAASWLLDFNSDSPRHLDLTSDSPRHLDLASASHRARLGFSISRLLDFTPDSLRHLDLTSDSPWLQLGLTSASRSHLGFTSDSPWLLGFRSHRGFSASRFFTLDFVTLALPH